MDASTNPVAYANGTEGLPQADVHSSYSRSPYKPRLDAAMASWPLPATMEYIRDRAVAYLAIRKYGSDAGILCFIKSFRTRNGFDTACHGAKDNAYKVEGDSTIDIRLSITPGGLFQDTMEKIKAWEPEFISKTDGFRHEKIILQQKWRERLDLKWRCTSMIDELESRISGLCEAVKAMARSLPGILAMPAHQVEQVGAIGELFDCIIKYYRRLSPDELLGLPLDVAGATNTHSDAMPAHQNIRAAQVVDLLPSYRDYHTLFYPEYRKGLYGEPYKELTRLYFAAVDLGLRILRQIDSTEAVLQTTQKDISNHQTVESHMRTASFAIDSTALQVLTHDERLGKSRLPGDLISVLTRETGLRGYSSRTIERREMVFDVISKMTYSMAKNRPRSTQHYHFLLGSCDSGVQEVVKIYKEILAQEMPGHRVYDLRYERQQVLEEFFKFEPRISTPNWTLITRIDDVDGVDEVKVLHDLRRVTDGLTGGQVVVLGGEKLYEDHEVKKVLDQKRATVSRFDKGLWNWQPTEQDKAETCLLSKFQKANVKSEAEKAEKATATAARRKMETGASTRKVKPKARKQ